MTTQPSTSLMAARVRGLIVVAAGVVAVLAAGRLIGWPAGLAAAVAWWFDQNGGDNGVRELCERHEEHSALEGAR